jgi:hypothetical protein
MTACVKESIYMAAAPCALVPAQPNENTMKIEGKTVQIDISGCRREITILRVQTVPETQ